MMKKNLVNLAKQMQLKKGEVIGEQNDWKIEEKKEKTEKKKKRKKEKKKKRKKEKGKRKKEQNVKLIDSSNNGNDKKEKKCQKQRQDRWDRTQEIHHNRFPFKSMQFHSRQDQFKTRRRKQE